MTTIKLPNDTLLSMTEAPAPSTAAFSIRIFRGSAVYPAKLPPAAEARVVVHVARRE